MDRKQYFTIRFGEVAPISLNSAPTLQELRYQEGNKRTGVKAHSGTLGAVSTTCLKEKHKKCYKASCSCACHNGGF